MPNADDLRAVYAALCERCGSAAEIARETGLPQATVEEAVQILARKRLIKEKPGCIEHARFKAS